MSSELDLQSRVIAALPVQNEIDEWALLLHHNLVERCAQYPLAYGRCRCGVRPCARQVGAERDQLLALGLAKWRTFLRNHGGHVAFGAVYRRKRFVPAPLQLASHEAIGRVDSVILPTGVSRLITRLGQRQLKLPLDRRCFARLRVQNFERGVHSKRRQDAQDLGANGCVSDTIAERDAARRAMVQSGAIAIVAAELAAVMHLQLAAAMTATQESCEKHFALAHCASGDRPAHSGRIIGNEALIALELVPGDVTLVLFLEQHVPFGDRAAHTAADVLAALDNADLAPRPPECIGAGVDRIGQYVVDGIISGQFPDDAGPLGSLRPGGQHDAFFPQPDMNLAYAAKLAEFREHQLQDFPHSVAGSFSIRSRPDFT